MHHRMFTALYRFSSVHHLELMNCYFPSFGLFRRMITALRQITRLYLLWISWPVPVRPQEATLLSHMATVQPLRLSQLDLRGCTSPELLYQLLFAPTTTASTLKHFMADARFLSAVPQCLERVGPALTTLEITIRKVTVDENTILLNDGKLSRYLLHSAD